MRYHLFLNFVVKVVKIAQTFCLDLAVRRYMSTSVFGPTWPLAWQLFKGLPCPPNR